VRRVLIPALVLWPALAPAQVAVLSVSPLHLAFDAARPAVSDGQLVRIRNLGSGVLRWRAIPRDPWVRVSPAEGTGPALLEVRIDADALGAGRHESRVTIDAGDADDSPVSVTVTAEVAPRAAAASGPPAAAEAGASRAAAPPGAEPSSPAAAVAAGAAPAAPLRFTAPSLPTAVRNLPYSHAVPVAGGTPPYSIRLVQGRLPRGLALKDGSISGAARLQGAYPVVLAVTDSAQPPATVAAALSLRVIVLFADTRLTVSPPALTLSAPRGASAARARLGISSGRQSLGWTASADAPWLRLFPASGTAPGAVDLEITPRSLARGAHTATVTVVMDGVPGSPARIPVTVIVQG